MRRFAIAIALLGSGVLVGNVLQADEPKKEEKKLARGDVAKLMKATHRGEKSPYSRMQAELKKETPDWDQLAKDMKAFDEMSTALKSAQLNYTPHANYTTSIEALGKATVGKDKKAANTAFVQLTRSCGSCHYGGARAMLKE